MSDIGTETQPASKRQIRPKHLNPAEDRRSFLERIGKLSLAVAFPQTEERESVDSVSPPPNQGQETEIVPFEEKMWMTIQKHLTGIVQAEQDPTLKPIVVDIQSLLEPTRNAFQRRLERIDALTHAMQMQSNSDDSPKLLLLAKKVIGRMGTIQAEDAISFHAERKDLQDRLIDLEYLCRTLLDKKLQRDTSEKEEKSKLTVFQNAPKFHRRSLGEQYAFTRGVMVELNELVDREVREEIGKDTSPRVTIDMYPGYTPTIEGRRFFEEDKQRIQTFLQRFPFFQKIFSKVELLSGRYFGSPLFDSSTGGWMFIEKESGERHYRATIMVNMDTSVGVGVFFPEITFAHEAIGHALDASFNHGFADQLSPQGLVERLTFQEEILNNPDWANHDETISQLFGFDPVWRPEYIAVIESGQKISTELFRRIILWNPRNIILENSDDGQSREILGSSGLPYIIRDPVYGPAFAFPPTDPRRFQTFDQFLEAYIEPLRQWATKGNIRSKIILWGLEGFRPILGRLAFTGDLSHPDQWWTANQWSRYCEVPILNAATYHVFLNGVDGVRRFIPQTYWAAIEQRILALRQRYREELFAEGCSHAYYFGPRMVDKPPFQVALEHAASLLGEY
ncbi:MAG: hypothetical protein Q8R11_01320 [bacterium]|nr:hypothetical protein [bacterium]